MPPRLLSKNKKKKKKPPTPPPPTPPPNPPQLIRSRRFHRLDRNLDFYQDQTGGYDLGLVMTLMSIKDLMEIAREINLPGRSKLRKNQLIDSLISFFE